MQAVSVQTTQNIELEYPLAGIGERMLAFLLDILIMFSFIAIVAAILSIPGFDTPDFLIWIVVIIAFLYRFFAEMFFNGQTVGKSVVKIRVVKIDGNPPSVANYFLRWLLEPIDFFIVGLAVVLIILNKRGQRLGDMLAGTTVVKVKRITAANVRNKAIMKPVDEDYVPIHSEAGNISDHDIRIIKDALSAYREDAAHKAVSALEQKLKEKYDIQSEQPTVKFLYTILRDHTYYVSR